MSEKNLLIWNGEFTEVPETEARKMAEAGACQIVDELEGADLKYAHEFKSAGYQNKAMATEVETTPAKVEKPVETEKPSYGTLRKLASEHFDKPYKETTREDVEAYQEATNEDS